MIAALSREPLPRFNARKQSRRKVKPYVPAELRPSHFLANAAASAIEAELDAAGTGFTREDRRADGVVLFTVDGFTEAWCFAVTDEAVSLELIKKEFREALRAVVVEET